MLNVMVSVVVPLYQKAPYVARSIRSILAQTRPPDEIIVVDDGSTDGGGEVVARIGDPRIRLLRQRNAGPGAARNRGLAVAKGSLVAFLDADDTWEPRFLERALARLEAHPEAVATSCSFRTDPGRSLAPLWRRRGLQDGLLRVGPETPAALVVALLAFMSPCTTVCRRDAVLALGGFYERDRCTYGEDAFLFLRVLLSGPVVVALHADVRVDARASQLSVRRADRELEPLYSEADELFAACPPPLRALLREVLAIRAGRAACVMAAWGRHKEARMLAHRFARWPDLRHRWVLLGTLLATRAGTVLATAFRYAHPSR